MKTPTIEHLNNSFSFHNGNHRLIFKDGEGDITFVEVQNDQASATISLQGAQLLSWVPTGEDEVIWVSEDAMFAPAKSIRGGIPVCWPWFGAHETNTAFPAHGFARTALWQVTDTQQLSAGETQITFRLDTNQLDASVIHKDGQHMWPTPTVAEYRLTIAKTLSIELTTINYSDQPITIGQALHSYFNVDDVSNVTVAGLEGKDYLDKTDSFKRKIQNGPVIIDTEVDRVYLETPDDIVIDDKKKIGRAHV